MDEGEEQGRLRGGEVYRALGLSPSANPSQPFMKRLYAKYEKYENTKND